MSVNALYQPWRAILSMINICLTGKTAGFDRPRHPVLQILWDKGKEKVVEEQAAHDLLTLQTPQKKRTKDMTDSETESDEEASKINAGNQEGQAGPNPGIQDEG
ncbi:hypothetical protein Tco_0436574 [Tanacetum coccineum]